jgi:Protein kinase domain
MSVSSSDGGTTVQSRGGVVSGSAFSPVSAGGGTNGGGSDPPSPVYLNAADFGSGTNSGPHSPESSPNRPTSLSEGAVAALIAERDALVRQNRFLALENRALRREVTVLTKQRDDAFSMWTAGPKIAMEDLGFIEQIGIDELTGDPKGKQGSELWKGRWGQLNFPVCIKKMNVSQQKLSNVHNFENEVQVMSQVRHPNICAFLGGSIEPHTIILVTELCSMDLTTFIYHSPEYTSYSMGKKLKLGKAICEGMAWLHGWDIIHCDLKPDNVLLDQAFQPKICE